jgi:glucokinase
VRNGCGVDRVCLAVAGLILAQENGAVCSPNLHAVEGVPLREELEPRIGLSLTLENDANAAAWGEFRFGAGPRLTPWCSTRSEGGSARV